MSTVCEDCIKSKRGWVKHCEIRAPSHVHYFVYRNDCLQRGYFHFIGDAMKRIDYMLYIAQVWIIRRWRKSRDAVIEYLLAVGSIFAFMLIGSGVVLMFTAP